MHFDLIYVFQFSARSKVIKGVKRSNSYFRSLNCTGQKPKQHPILLGFVASCPGQWVKQKSQWPWPGQRSTKGHYGSMNFYPIDWKFSTFPNGKTDTVNMLYMVRDTKVSTVTPTSDEPLRGQRSKGHFHIMAIYNFIIRARITKIYQQIPWPHMSL